MVSEDIEYFPSSIAEEKKQKRVRDSDDISTLKVVLDYIDKKIEEHNSRDTLNLNTTELKLKQQVAVSKEVVSILKEIKGGIEYKINVIDEMEDDE